MQVLVFGAPWCASCTVLKKQLAGLTFPGFEIEHVNVDTDPEVATKHKVMSLPTIVVPSSGLVRRNVTTAKQFADLLASV
jgi:thioredoxin-like negative regulator of GroEL